MKKIITISREFGAGGRSIGREVAGKLGIAFYDRDIILKKESCVIVGRNADYILREFDHLLRVFVYADKEWRVRHLKTLMDGTDSEIEAKMNQADKARKNYCSKLTGKVYGDALNYDLSINTGKLSFDKAVELILNTVDAV